MTQLGPAPADECGCCWRNGARRTPLDSAARPPLCAYCARCESLDVLPHSHTDPTVQPPPPARYGEDLHTTTVDGAAAHARQHGPDPTDCHHRPGQTECVRCVTPPY